jgi:dTDP-4-dehydrorhamnose reductase
LVSAFSSGGYNTIGVGFKRSGNGIVKADLRNRADVDALLFEHKPKIIIHAAAERRPDLIEKNADEAWRINVECTSYVVEGARQHGAWLLYISSDYVFDGTQPPYSVHDETNPLSLYGKTKLEGEKIVLGAGFAALRVPLLYGPVENWGECSITEIVSVLLQNIGKTAWFDNWAIRYPTHIGDVARLCVMLSSKHLETGSVSGIYQASADEAFTKLEMAMIMAQKLDITDISLLPLPAPINSMRPKDSHLDSSTAHSLGWAANRRFVEGIAEVLAAFKR